MEIIKSQRKNKSSFDINLEQFTSPNTPEVCYILGLIWADGYIQKTGAIKVALIKDDMEEVYHIFLKTGKWNMSYRERENRKVQMQVYKNHTSLRDFLYKNGYQSKSNGSADKILSIIPENLKHYWFRGLVDGDGCFYTNKNQKCVSISSSYGQDWTYMERLSKGLNINYHIHRRHGKTGSNSSFYISDLNSIIKFSEFIYNDYVNDKIGFSRKYKKWLDIKNKLWVGLERDKKIMEFIEIKTNEVVSMNRKDFLIYSKLNSNDWHNLISKSDAAVRGWNLLEKHIERNGKPYRNPKRI